MKSLWNLPARRGIVSAVAMATVVALLSACSSQAPSTTSAKSTQLSTVKIATFAPGLMTSVPIYIAHRYGYFKDNGINFEQVDVTDGKTAAAALLSGSVDAANIAGFSLFAAAAKGQITPYISGLDNAQTTELVVSPSLKSAARKGYPAALRALKGKKIGITSIGSSQYYELAYSLEQAGLSTSDVTFVSLGGNASGETAALKTGQIDGFITSYPTTEQLVDDGDAVVAMYFWKGHRPKLIAEQVDAGIAATEHFVTSNPTAARGIHDAIAEAVKKLEGITSKTAPAMAKVLAPDFPGYTRAQVADSLMEYRDTYSATITKANVEAVNQTLLHFNAIPKAIPYDTIVAKVARG